MPSNMRKIVRKDARRLSILLSLENRLIIRNM